MVPSVVELVQGVGRSRPTLGWIPGRTRPQVRPTPGHVWPKFASFHPTSAQTGPKLVDAGQHIQISVELVPILVDFGLNLAHRTSTPKFDEFSVFRRGFGRTLGPPACRAAPDLAMALVYDPESEICRISAEELGTISNQKPDGSFKHTIIHDMRRSLVNEAVRRLARQVLPRPIDHVVELSCVAHGCGVGQCLQALTLYFKDAFMPVPLDEVGRPLLIVTRGPAGMNMLLRGVCPSFLSARIRSTLAPGRSERRNAGPTAPPPWGGNAVGFAQGLQAEGFSRLGPGPVAPASLAAPLPPTACLPPSRSRRVLQGRTPCSLRRSRSSTRVTLSVVNTIAAPL